MTPTESLRRRLRKARQMARSSLLDTARSIDPERDPHTLAQRIYRLERAKRPDLDLAAQVAAATGTSLCALLAPAPLRTWIDWWMRATPLERRRLSKERRRLEQARRLTPTTRRRTKAPRKS